jgi:hypothetical protein
MSSHPQTAAIGVPRRPAPPRSAASYQAFASPVSYVPEQYDPRQVPAPMAMTAGQFGLVRPKQRTGRAVWLALLLILAASVAFVGWRASRTGAPTEAGVAYTSAAGHFSVRFPAAPIESTRTARDGPSRLTLRLADVPGQGAVAEVHVAGSPAGTMSKLADRLAAGVGSHGISLSSVKHFTFHGMRAVQGNYIQPSTGELVTVLVAARSTRELFLIVGRTGSTFDALKTSFAVVP